MAVQDHPHRPLTTKPGEQFPRCEMCGVYLCDSGDMADRWGHWIAVPRDYGSVTSYALDVLESTRAAPNALWPVTKAELDALAVATTP